MGAIDNLSKPASTKPLACAIINKEATVNYLSHKLMRARTFKFDAWAESYIENGGAKGLIDSKLTTKG